ncbi:condensation domain-containing protein, partial [Vibrio neptunius]
MLPLIRQIKEAKISLWVDDNNLELCYQDDSAMELILNVIKPNKENLLHFLKENNVFSQIDFDRKTIFKCTSEFSPLSFIQESLLFIEKMENGTNAYHIPHVVKLRHGANLDLLLSSINLIAERHQILKSVYEEHPELGEVQRYVPGTIPLYSATIDASADLDII